MQFPVAESAFDSVAVGGNVDSITVFEPLHDFADEDIALGSKKHEAAVGQAKFELALIAVETFVLAIPSHASAVHSSIQHLAVIAAHHSFFLFEPSQHAIASSIHPITPKATMDIDAKPR